MYYLQHPYHSKKVQRITTVPGSSGDMTVSQVTENGVLNNKIKNVLKFSTRKGNCYIFTGPWCGPPREKIGFSARLLVSR